MSFDVRPTHRTKLRYHCLKRDICVNRDIVRMVIADFARLRL